MWLSPLRTSNSWTKPISISFQASMSSRSKRSAWMRTSFIPLSSFASSIRPKKCSLTTASKVKTSLWPWLIQQFPMRWEIHSMWLSINARLPRFSWINSCRKSIRLEVRHLVKPWLWSKSSTRALRWAILSRTTPQNCWHSTLRIFSRLLISSQRLFSRIVLTSTCPPQYLKLSKSKRTNQIREKFLFQRTISIFLTARTTKSREKTWTSSNWTWWSVLINWESNRYLWICLVTESSLPRREEESKLCPSMSGVEMLHSRSREMHLLMATASWTSQPNSLSFQRRPEKKATLAKYFSIKTRTRLSYLWLTQELVWIKSNRKRSLKCSLILITQIRTPPRVLE